MNVLKKIVSCTTAAALLCTVVSFSASAEDENGKVRIIVENNTFKSADGAVWEGTLIDEWVELKNDSTAVSLLNDALASHGFVQTGAENNWITDVNGLSAGADAAQMGGWMVGFDDWYGNGGIGTLKPEDGDEISLSYSLTWGTDIGADYNNTSTKLSSLTFDSGDLKGDSDENTYILTLPEGTESVIVTPVAENKNYRYKIYKNEYTPDRDGTDYKKSREIPVEDDDVIYIGVGHPQWHTYAPEGLEETVYRVSIDIDQKKTESSEESSNDTSEESSEKEQPDDSNTKTSEITEESGNDENSNTTEELPSKTQQDDKTTADDVSVIIDEVTERIKSDDILSAVGNEWSIFTLARLGKLDQKTAEEYSENLKSFLNENEINKATDCAKYILVVTALGFNADDFYGIDLTEKLSDKDFIFRQGINGPVYTLLALDSAEYKIPEAKSDSVQADRENIIQGILSAQLADGGWAFFGETSEPDMTGIVLQSLSPYYDSDDKVKSAVDRAVDMLSSIQNSDGTYTSYGAPNCENSAQIVLALSTLGIDADKDERFVKENGSALDGLKKYYITGRGMFSHELNGQENALSTLQSYYSMCGYKRMIAGQNSLFDLRDAELIVNIESGKNEESISPQGNNTVSEPEKIVYDNKNITGNDTDKTVSDKNNNTSGESDESSKAVPTGDSGTTALGIVIVISLLTAVILSVKKPKGYSK